jgi:hypothetical protein
MDEEAALEQLDTLLQEISEIDNKDKDKSRPPEQKTESKNIDILQEFVSQASASFRMLHLCCFTSHF